jgi:serine/threonine protein kinase
LRLIHDHLARLPTPPADINQDLPEPLSKIILHLLEKEPRNRYQSADGMVHDLERLRDTRAGHGEFRVGEPLRPASSVRDSSPRLRNTGPGGARRSWGCGTTLPRPPGWAFRGRPAARPESLYT